MKTLQQIYVFLSLYLILGRCFGEFGNVGNLINTGKCTIPDIPPFGPDLSINSFIKTMPVPCTTFDQLLTYTTVQNGVARLHMRNDVIAKYFGSPDNISCCYSYVFRNGAPNNPDKGIVVSNCYKFENSVEVAVDTVWVRCSILEEHELSVDGFSANFIYENIHHIIKMKDYVRKKAEKLKASTFKKPISVLIVVIDAVSRLNFIRTMPKTRKFIMDNQFYEFTGYNKVDDNTFPNAMAFLTGMNLEDSYRTCKPEEVDGLINCPMIWYTYRDLGYATAFGEDWSDIATFNYYLKKGFKSSPTDYYLKSYMDSIKYLRPIWQDYMPFCAGPESQGDRILNVAYDFATTLRGLPSFGVFWMNTFSHNTIGTPRTMDQNVRNFFERLKYAGVLDESIVILLSDHGIRFGEINNTPRGYYEVRLPMHYASLPSWFKQKYPEETQKFKENSGKLTSTYDLHMTLQHILNISGTNYTVRPSRACPSCKSFFENIPVERSCFDAGIPEKWCTCNVNFNKTFNNSHVQKEN